MSSLYNGLDVGLLYKTIAIKSIYLSLITCCLFFCGFSQVVNVGFGSDKGYSPYIPGTQYSYCQTIYLASELNASAGLITTLNFDYFSGNLNNSNKLRIYLGHTVKTNFSNDSDWISVGNMTLVYDTFSTVVNPQLGGLVTIPLTTSFQYNGTDNLVIAINEMKAGSENNSNNKFSGILLNKTNRTLCKNSTNTGNAINENNPPLGSRGNIIGNLYIYGLTNKSCPDIPVNFIPNNIVLTGLSPTKASATWPIPTGTPPTSYQWEARDSANPGSGSAGLLSGGSSTTNAASVTNLKKGGNYTFYVRSVCSSGVYSGWKAISDISCGPEDVPYSVDFSNGFPACTSTAWYGLGSPWVAQNGSTGSHGACLQYCDLFNSGPADAWFYTEYVNLKKDSSYTVSFKCDGYGNPFVNKLDVSGMVSISLPSVVTVTNIEKTFIASSTGSGRLAFHCTSIAGQGCMFVNDILVKRTITCGVPQAINVSNIYFTTANINWSPPSIGVTSGTKYQLFLSTVNPGTNGGYTPTMTGITNTSVALSNLLIGTTYYYSLRTICRPGDTTSWTPIASFSTICTISNLPYSENFETASVPDIPMCTKVLKTGNCTDWKTVYNGIASFPGKALVYNTSNTAPSDGWFFTRGFNLVGGNTYRLSFKYGNTAGSTAVDKLEVKYGTSPFIPDMTNLLLDLPSIRLNGSSGMASILFTPIFSVDFYIGFHAYSAQGIGADIYIDDILVTQPNTLLASAFMDNNSNNIKENSEPYFLQGNIEAKKGSQETIVANALSGTNLLFLDTGKYVSTIKTYFPYYTSTPVIHNTFFTTYGNADTATFALQAIPGKRDGTIAIIPINDALPGQALHYRLRYVNMGTDTIATGNVRFVKNNKVSFAAAYPAPTTVIADTLIWDISNMRPLDTASIDVELLVLNPPAANIGDTLVSSAAIATDKTDVFTLNNTSNIKQKVVGANSANNKIENHGGKITTTQVADGEYLQYTIDFQNTANGIAYNAYIRDTLSNNLDWNTLQVVSASHDYHLTMSDGICLFAFENINILDSSQNQSQSRGYVVYKIKPKSNIQIGDVINNTAAISFDANLPVNTNTQVTIVTGNTFPVRLLLFTAKKENKVNILQWKTAQEINADRFEIQRSFNGHEFSTIGKIKAGLSNYNFNDNNPQKTINYYRLKMVDKDGAFTYSPVRTVNNSGTFSISISPNPAKDNLRLQINNDKKTTLQSQIFSQDGKVVFSNSFAATEGSILRNINISSLSKGSYFLKVTSIEKEENVIKFEKQ